VQEQKKVQELYAKHDTDLSGGLHDAQLKAFMQDYVKTLPDHKDKVVTAEEAKYVMAIADSMGDGEVEEADITEAVAVSCCAALRHRRRLSARARSLVPAATWPRLHAETAGLYVSSADLAGIARRPRCDCVAL
jgi:hypothetical protein